MFEIPFFIFASCEPLIQLLVDNASYDLKDTTYVVQSENKELGKAVYLSSSTPPTIMEKNVDTLLSDLGEKVTPLPNAILIEVMLSD